MAELVRGSVEDRPWGRTFATFGLRAVTGQLTLVAEGKRFVVVFEEGAVVAAASPLAADAAVRVALTSHLVSSSQVAEIARRQALAPDRDEVDVIGELARLGADHTLRLRRRVIAQRAARTFALAHGAFVVTDQVELPVLPGCALDVRALIYLGARANLAEQRLSDELDRLGTWFRIKPDAVDDLPQFGFGDVEQPILERLRDGGTVSELEAFAGDLLDVRTVHAVIYALASYSACDVLPRPAAGHRTATTLPPIAGERRPSPAAAGSDRAPRGFVPTSEQTPERLARIALTTTTATTDHTPERLPRMSPPDHTPERLPRARPGSSERRASTTMTGTTTAAPTTAGAPTGSSTGSSTGSPTGSPTGSSAAPGTAPTGPVDRARTTGSVPAFGDRPRAMGSIPVADRSRGPTPAPASGDVSVTSDSQPRRERSTTRSPALAPTSPMPPIAPPGVSFDAPTERDPAIPAAARALRHGDGSDTALRPPRGPGDRRADSEVGDAPERGERRGERSSGSIRIPSEAALREAPRQGSSGSIRVPPESALRDEGAALRGAGARSSASLQLPPDEPAAAPVIMRVAAARPPAKTRQLVRTDSAQSHEVKSLIAQRLKLLDQGADHFSLLGVGHDCSGEALRKAYFALARQLHPDRLAALGISDDGKHAQRLFAQINAGFAVLSDQTRRASYLSVLRRGGEAAVRAEQARAEELARRILEAEEAFRRGELAIRRDQPAAAVADLERAVQLNPDESDYVALLAWAQFCASPDRQAIAGAVRRSLEDAIARSPRSVTGRFYLGRVERMLGQDAEALRHFRDVLAASPSHAEAAAEVRVIEARLASTDKPTGGGLFSRLKR